MSPRNSNNSGKTPAPLDVYAGLMMVSTCALLIGTIILVLTIGDQYAWKLPQ